MSLTALEQALSRGLDPVYVVLGDALPLVERATHAIQAAVLPRVGLPAFNHSRYRASEPNAVTAFSAARTLPMMADLRLVELRDLQEASNDLFGALVDYLAAPSSGSVLLVVGTGFPKVEKGGSNWGARVKNALKGHGRLIQISSEDASPVRFVVETAAARGKQLGLREAELLVEVVGADLGRLQQEVEKLALFVGEADRIDADAIQAAGSLLAEAVIWDLTTGLAARDPELALGSLHRLQAAGDDARKLLGMIAWQVRELLRAKELIEGGASDRDVTSKVRLRWELYKRVRPVLADGFPDAADLLRRLATANRQMNSHRAGADRILEGLVLEMLEGRLRRPPPVPR